MAHNPEQAPDGNPDFIAGTNEYANLSAEQPLTQPVPEVVAPTQADEHITGVIRTDRSSKHYEKAFGPEVKQPEGLVLDLGAGDSNYAESVNDTNLKAVRFDYGYKDDAPEYTTGAVAGLAQELPFADNSFTKVVESYMMQHIPADQVPMVFKEIVRVTKPE